MKKRFLILAGVLALTVAVSGCGKKKDTDVQPVAASATPTPEVTKAAEIVDMKQPTEEEIANIMGEESATASKVIFVNNMGSDISSVYIRQHVEDEDDSDDDTWGSDLVDGKFTLKDKDKALYYFSPNATEDSTKSTASYDIRVGFTDEDKNECFFRDIPLGTISQITLCMSGTDEDAIPYAKYLTGSTKQEISTLNDVKKRLGMTDDSDSTDDQNTNSVMILHRTQILIQIVMQITAAVQMITTGETTVETTVTVEMIITAEMTITEAMIIAVEMI